MVRYKKRYFVIQLDRHSDLIPSPPTTTTTTSTSTSVQGSAKKKKRLKLNASLKRRSLCDPNPLALTDGQLSNAIKDVVTQIHGDFGRASVTMGLRTIYCNPETRLCLLQCRHGPHRLVASSIPFLQTIGQEEKLIPRLIYTGATIRNCYKKMESYQRRQLESALLEFGPCDETEKEIFKEKLSQLRDMKH